VTAPTQETRIELRSLLGGLGALLLLVSLFLDWYGDPDDNAAISAWSSFELLDVVLAALALAVLYEVARVVADRRWTTAAGFARFAGPVALVLVVVSMIDEPPIAFFIDPELEVGIWIAFAGALLMTLGALLTRFRISFVVSGREPAATPPAPGPPPHDPDAETQTLR
jgi:hypothetical protein